jgi:hypothetical protein
MADLTIHRAVAITAAGEWHGPLVSFEAARAQALRWFRQDPVEDVWVESFEASKINTVQVLKHDDTHQAQDRP